VAARTRRPRRSSSSDGSLVVAVAALFAAPSPVARRAGGTLVVAEPAEDIDSIDAAIGYTADGAPLYSTVCAAPYHIAEFVPGRSIVAERNRYYAGPRPLRVDGSCSTWGSTAARRSTT
jgi:ABC-type transport system substrate-binding protein